MKAIITVDDTLVKEAGKVGKPRTNEAAVTVALEEYIQLHRQVDILKLFGEIDYDPEYNYKKNRNR